MVTKVSVCNVDERYTIPHFNNPVFEPSRLMFMICDRVLQMSKSGFDCYDEISMTVVVHPGREALDTWRTDGWRSW